MADHTVPKNASASSEAQPANAAALGADPAAIEAQAAQERARLEIEAESQRVLAEANAEAQRIVEDARKAADKLRAESGLIPTRESENRKVDNGTIKLRYIGTSDRFYIGADEDGRAVFADAGGEPVFVTKELRDKLLRLPRDRFEEVK